MAAAPPTARNPPNRDRVLLAMNMVPGGAMMRPVRSLLLAAVALLAVDGGAFAATCREQAAQFARDYDLQWPKSPATVESRGTAATDEFAPAEGPVEPPAGDRAATSEPPDETPPENIPAPTGERLGDLTAEQRTRMEALLLEAIKAAEEGESERCFERLSEAKSVP